MKWYKKRGLDRVNPGEFQIISFNYAPGKDFNDLKSALYGDLLIGMRVQSVAPTGGSQRYLSDPIPEPATMALLGLGIAGLALRRGKSMLRG